MRTYLGMIGIETDGDAVVWVDRRLSRWLMQWLAPSEAARLIAALSKRRLVELVIAYRSQIEAML